MKPEMINEVYDVTDNSSLPPVPVDRCTKIGDPLEINHEMYYICEMNYTGDGELSSVGVIPLVVRNTVSVEDIQGYLNCLSLARGRDLKRNGEEPGDPDECSD